MQWFVSNRFLVDAMNTKTIAAFVAIAVVGAGVYVILNRDTTSPDTDAITTRPDEARPVDQAPEETVTEAPSDSSDATTETSQPDEATAASTPYNATATYLTPARTSHEVDVTLSLASDGIVTGANVTYDNSDGYSNAHQERFDAAFRDEVIGKTITAIDLSQVGGASLTSEAFNEAVAEIAAQYDA